MCVCVFVCVVHPLDGKMSTASTMVDVNDPLPCFVLAWNGLAHLPPIYHRIYHPSFCYGAGRSGQFCIGGRWW